MLMIWVGGISLSLAVASFLIFAVTTLFNRPTLGGGPPGTHAAIDLAGAAKVIDAVRKAGPSLSALIASVVFAWLAFEAAKRVPVEAQQNKNTLNVVSLTTLESCTLGGFADGQDRIPQGDGDSSGLVQNSRTGCLPALVSHLKKEDPLLVMLIGRVDRRELRTKVQAAYGSNFNLAYQRATAMKNYLSERSGKPGLPMIALAAGPANLDRSAGVESMAQDRCVEMFALWRGAVEPPK
jgi:hypothetical protein